MKLGGGDFEQKLKTSTMGGCFWHQPLLLASAAALLLLLASAAASSGTSSDCPYTSFTWVARRADNPYFWKSPDFDWDAISTLAVFGDITAYDDTIELRDYAQSLGIKVVAGTADPTSAARRAGRQGGRRAAPLYRAQRHERRNHLARGRCRDHAGCLGGGRPGRRAHRLPGPRRVVRGCLCVRRAPVK